MSVFQLLPAFVSKPFNRILDTFPNFAYHIVVGQNKQQIIRILLALIIIIFIFTAIIFLNTLNTSSKTSPQQNNKSISSAPISKVFPYDTKNAEKLLEQYIKNTVKPEFLPAKIEIKQGLTIDKTLADEFTSSFTAADSTVSASFHFIENSSISNDFEIFIQLTDVTQATATTSLANSLLSSYFSNPLPVSNCQKKNTSSYCENFQTLKDAKVGYGIILAPDGNKLAKLVFTCKIPKESKDYDTSKSCINP